MKKTGSAITSLNFWTKHEVKLGEFIFLLAVAAWGLTYVFTKDALAVIGPFAYNTLRMGLGVITLVVLSGAAWRKLSRAYIVPSVVSGLLLFAAYGTQTYGQQFTSASKAGFLAGTYVIYVPIFSALLLRRMPGLFAGGGVIFAFAGLTMLSLEPGSLSLAAGDAWLAASGVAWALYFVAMAYYSPRVNIMLYSILHIFLAGVLNGLCWLWLEPLTVPWQSPVLWVALLSTGVLVIGLGTSITTWVTRLISPTRVVLIGASEPVFAALGGWWIGEAITIRIVTGGLLIVMGMLLAELGPVLRQTLRRRRWQRYPA